MLLLSLDSNKVLLFKYKPKVLLLSLCRHSVNLSLSSYFKLRSIVLAYILYKAVTMPTVLVIIMILKSFYRNYYIFSVFIVHQCYQNKANVFRVSGISVIIVFFFLISMHFL